MRQAITITAVLLGLAACGPDAEEPVVEPLPENERPGPAADPAADEMSWLVSEGEIPALTYGVPQTDNVQIWFRCVGPGQLEAGFIRPEAALREEPAFTLASNGVQATFPVTTEPVELGENTVSAQSQIPTDDPVIQAFAETGSLELTAGDLGPVDMPATGKETQMIAGFFSRCGT
jgi:hypothetical protein